MRILQLGMVTTAVLALACGGGGSGEDVSGTAPTATATAAGLSVKFSDPDSDNVLTLSNLRADENGLVADIAIDNTSATTVLRLDLTSSRAHLLTAVQAEAWKAGYPRAYQELDLKGFPDTTPSSEVPIVVNSTSGFPVEVGPGQKWSGSISSSVSVDSDMVAIFLVLSNVGRQQSSGFVDGEIYSADATHPFVGLKGEVTVTPLPPIEPMAVNPGDKMLIPKINLDMPLTLLLVGRDGRMPEPLRQNVALYDFGAFGLGIGGSPKVGNAVIAAYYHPTNMGPEPFARVLELTHGDTIEVVYQGQNYRYTVAWKCTVPNSNFTEIIRKDNANTLTLFPSVGGTTQYIIRAEQTPGSISESCPPNTAPFTGTELPQGAGSGNGSAAGTPSLAFVERFAPGNAKVHEALAGQLVYRFTVVGFGSYTFNPNLIESVRITLSPAPPALPEGRIRGLSCCRDSVLDIAMPPGIAAGEYEISLTAPDGRSTATRFLHQQ